MGGWVDLRVGGPICGRRWVGGFMGRRVGGFEGRWVDLRSGGFVGRWVDGFVGPGGWNCR